MLGLGRPAVARRPALQRLHGFFVEIADDELGHGNLADSDAITRSGGPIATLAHHPAEPQELAGDAPATRTAEPRAAAKEPRKADPFWVG